MSDFSVKKSSNTKNVNKSSTVKTAYLKLKAEYLAMKKRIAKSDFANAPVTLNSELEELKKLKEFAQKENLTKEIVWIEEREQELKNKISYLDSPPMVDKTAELHQYQNFYKLYRNHH